jgi:hypothetical protein
MASDEEHPPGARNLVRVLVETLQAHNDVLAGGDRLTARLTPEYWTGPARDTFVAKSLPELESQ